MNKRWPLILCVMLLSACMLIFSGCELWEDDDDEETVAASSPEPARAAPVQASSPSSSSSNSSSSSSHSSSSSSGATVSGGSAGFLWKPVSESNGNLVILLPSNLRPYVRHDSQGCCIFQGGSKVECGRFHTDTHNGNRPHFFFSKPGANFGTNLQVVATMKAGDQRKWNIPNGVNRYEY